MNRHRYSVQPEPWAVVLAQNVMLEHDADMTTKDADGFRDALASLFQQTYNCGSADAVLDTTEIESWWAE